MTEVDKEFEMRSKGLLSRDYSLRRPVPVKRRNRTGCVVLHRYDNGNHFATKNAFSIQKE